MSSDIEMVQRIAELEQELAAARAALRRVMQYTIWSEAEAAEPGLHADALRSAGGAE